MATIEEQIKELPANKCRACEYYIRVNFDGYRNVVNRQGFCILGRLDGDYSLYLSSSRSYSCMGYLLSEKNRVIYEAENKMDSDQKDYLESLRDKRTANYKEAEPLLKAHQEYSLQKKYSGIAWLEAEAHLREIGCDRFYELNKERIIAIYHMVTLKKADYLKFLAQLSIKIHDQFCKKEV